MEEPGAKASPARRPRRLGAAVRGGLLALLPGAALAAVEGGLLLFLGGLRFTDPGRELLRVQVLYAAAAALLAGLFGLALPRRRSRSLVAASLGLLAGVVALWWLRTRTPLAEAAWNAPAGLAALGGAIVLGVLLLVGLRRQRPAVLLLVALLLAGGGQALARYVAPRAGGDLAGRPPQAAPPGAPDVVVVLIDTLRADHLGCYGYERRPTSPVLDGLAERGALFEQAIAQAPWTRPSVASLFTGLYPASHDTVTIHSRLPDALPTLATWFREHGWQTAGFSANTQISPGFGFARGFEHFWCKGSGSLEAGTALGGLKGLFRRWLILTDIPKRLVAWGLMEGTLGGAPAAVVNARVEDWLPEADPERPRFLYVHYIDPHHPYRPPEYLLPDPPEDTARLHEVLPVIKDFLPGDVLPDPGEEVREGLLSLYDQEIRYVDRELGRLLERLEAAGVLGPEDWLVVTSDHGEEFHDHGQWLHGGSLFQELIHVPLIVQGPGVLPGLTLWNPVELVDVLPTLAAAAGAPLDFEVHGRDLAPMLRGEAGGDLDREVVSQDLAPPRMEALLQGDRKLIHAELPDRELWYEFDLDRDPGETAPPVATPDAGLLQAFRAAMERAGQYLRARAETVDWSDAERANLEALGYAEGGE